MFGEIQDERRRSFSLTEKSNPIPCDKSDGVRFHEIDTVDFGLDECSVKTKDKTVH